MLQGYRYRLYPSPEAERLLGRYAAAERAIYNRAVQHQRELRELALRRRRLGGRMVWPRGEALTYSDVSAWIAGDERAAWLGEVPGQVRAQAVRIARRALVDSIRLADRRPPRFRSRHGGSDGFAWQASTAAELRKVSGRWHEVRLPARRGTSPVWCRVRVDAGRQPPPDAFRPGKVLRVTHDAAGTWWLTLTGPSTGAAAAPSAGCGVDVGVVHTLTLADDAGRVLHMDLPALLSAGEAGRMRALERAQSRARDSVIPCRRRPCPHGGGECWRQSERYARRRRQIAELERRAQRRRRDWIERVTTYLADRYELVAVEDLRIRSMTASAAGTVEAPGRNVASKRALNRAILEQGWGLLVRRLEEKLAARGGRLVRVPAPNTSRRCFECGHIAAANRNTQARFVCAACGHADGADANAARNILDLALQGHPPARGGAAAERASAPVAAKDVEARRWAAEEASITLAA